MEKIYQTENLLVETLPKRWKNLLPKGWKSLRMTTIPKLWIMCGNLPKIRRNVSDGNMPKGWMNGGPFLFFENIMVNNWTISPFIDHFISKIWSHFRFFAFFKKTFQF